MMSVSIVFFWIQIPGRENELSCDLASFFLGSNLSLIVLTAQVFRRFLVLLIGHRVSIFEHFHFSGFYAILLKSLS